LIKQTERIPYCITLKDKPAYYFMLGVSREWENVSRQQSADTFAVVTRSGIGNTIMEQVHNTKQRMPTIVPETLAVEWLQPGLSKERIMQIASYQMPSHEMTAWTIAKDFLKLPDPVAEVKYDHVPDIVYE
jgi:putative SOS response-associated peptidase YedK